ncbi:MAG TPA: hypothetical protein VF868_15815 [Bacteroidia bacterium]
MNKQLRFISLLLLLISGSRNIIFSQTAFASEDELKQQALKLFEEDEFEEAYPLYSQLVSLYPKDPNYNYRLGVCMLYASDDKEKAIPFLEFSSKKPDVEKEAVFYLAKAYHLNYRFDDAIAQYLAYMKVASESKSAKLQVERQIEMCRSGKKLLRNITDLLVLEKKDLSRADFYRAYDISGLGGKLLAKPDEEAFRTPLDKKKKEKSIIYLATNNNQVYFSSFGDDIEHGKDIYLIRKLPNGEWSKAQTLGYPVNTEYDEDFPFLHPNGKVLYFCSRGHNSMGGYDIFKTTLNEETNTWNKPVNLDFPINTPDDDILYVTNEDEKEAYFSSARASKTGRTAVFHINVERKPIDVAIVKGMVIKTKDNQALDVKITVKDLGDNTILGIYNAKETGNYLINLPNGGRFMYTVEAAGFNTQSEIVLLPTQYEFKPLKQEISYEPGTDKLVIKNLFDEPVDDQSYLLALNFIKEKAKLEAGVDAANASAKNNTQGTTEENTAANTASENTDKTSGSAKSNTTGTGLSNDAIVKIAYDDAKETASEAKDLQEQADIALNIANQKNELAQNKAREATQLMADANSMSDDVKKQTVVEEANQASAESDELNRETVAAFNIAKKLQQKAAAKEEEADLSLQYAKALDAAVKSKNPGEALERLKEQEQKLEALSEKNGNAEPDNIYAGLKMDADVKKRELDKSTQAAADIKQEIADNLALIETLKADAEKTKKDDLKQGLLDQIEGLKADNEQSKKDLEASEQKIARLAKDYNGIQNEMALVSSVVDKAKAGTNEDAAASVASIDKSKLEQQVNEIRINDNVPVPAAVKEPHSSEKSGVAVNGNQNKSEGTAAGNTSIQSKTEDVAVNVKNSDNAAASDPAVNSNASNSSSSGQKEYANVFADQLAALESIQDPLAKENKKAGIYKELTTAINEDLNGKRSLLKTEKDKARKKELNAEIAALEKELKVRSEEQAIVVANAEKLSRDIASANSVKEAGNADAAYGTTAGTDTPGNVNTSSNADPLKGQQNSGNYNSTASLNSINSDFSEKLKETESISGALAREVAKAAVFKEWSEAISLNIEKQKEELKSSTDPEMKALLEKKIKDSEALAGEKQTMYAASSDQVKNLRDQQDQIASNTSGNSASGTSSNTAGTNNNESAAEIKSGNDPVMNANTETPLNNSGAGNNDIAANNARAVALKKLDDGIAAASVEPDVRTAEIKKQEAYKAYIAEVEKVITTKEQELKSEQDQTKKSEISNDISALKSDVKAKEQLFAASEAKISALSDPAIASNGHTTDPVNTQGNTTNGNDPGANAADAAATSSSNTNNTEDSAGNSGDSSTSGTANKTKADVPFAYTDPSAIARSKESEKANAEIETLITKANDLKEEAAEKTSLEEKNALFSQANELIDQADAKRLNAVKLTSEANTAEFVSNRDVLNQYAEASVNNKSDEAAMAEMMKDESITYFARAQKSRDLAGSVSSDIDKLSALEDATANERIALEKQRRATEIYKKVNPGFVTVRTTNPVNNTALNSANSGKVNPDPAVGDNANKTRESLASANDPVLTESGTPGTSLNKNEQTTAKNAPGSSGNNAPENNTPDNNTSGNNTFENNTSGNNTSENTASGDTTPTDNIAAGNTESTSGSVNKESKNDSPANETVNSNSDPLAVNKTEGSSGNPVSADNNTAGNSSKEGNQTVIPDAVSTNNNTGRNTGNAPENTDSNGTAVGSDVNSAGNAGNTIGSNSVTENNNLTGGGNTSRVVLAPTEKFVRTSQPVYSAARPIPVNETLPEGLIYKVQIGAFRNPIAPEQFSGMSPITAETTPQGLTRYTAGLFTKFSTADQVKNEIRDLGYKDAFVVVFLDGKRISATQALALQGGNQAETTNTLASSTENKTNTPTESASNNTAGSGNTVIENTASASADNKIAKSENVAAVGGLFYTVQVGVFSKPVTSARLYNIQPLYAENTANGYIRYNTGIYNNLQRAIEARNIVSGAGIKDAYVTAYYKGKRISLSEAKELETQGTSFTSSSAVNQLPDLSGSTLPVNTDIKAVPDPVRTETQTPSEVTAPPAASTELKDRVELNNNMPVDSGLVFKVQIGAFKDEVPLEIANQFLKIASKGIKNYKDANGLTIYTLGNFKTYEEAQSLKNEISSIVTDAFIVAYNNGTKISVDEAKGLGK